MTAQADRPLPPEPDFAALGSRLSRIMAEIIHRPQTDTERSATGVDLYAIGLRRLLASPSSGFVPYREMVHTLNGHTVIDRLNAEDAKEQARAARAEADRVRAQVAPDLAAALRRWCNEVTVPSAYRRQGVELAAQCLERMGRYNAALARAAEAGPLGEEER